MENSYIILNLDEEKKIKLQKICCDSNTTIEKCIEKIIDSIISGEPGIISMFSDLEKKKPKKTKDLESIIIKKNKNLKNEEINDIYNLIDNE